jgi:hypothetical protein
MTYVAHFSFSSTIYQKLHFTHLSVASPSRHFPIHATLKALKSKTIASI